MPQKPPSGKTNNKTLNKSSIKGEGAAAAHAHGADRVFRKLYDIWMV